MTKHFGNSQIYRFESEAEPAAFAAGVNKEATADVMAARCNPDEANWERIAAILIFATSIFLIGFGSGVLMERAGRGSSTADLGYLGEILLNATINNNNNNNNNSAVNKIWEAWRESPPFLKLRLVCGRSMMCRHLFGGRTRGQKNTTLDNETSSDESPTAADYFEAAASKSKEYDNLPSY